MAHKLISAKYKKFYNNLPYGTPSVIKIVLDKNDYEGEITYPAGENVFELDADGEFVDTNGVVEGKLSLWCNGNGNTGSQYKITDPDGYTWNLVLLPDSPSNLTALRSQQVAPGTPIETITSLISAQTANHITFSPALVADQAARLALTGLRKFHTLQQADNASVYMLVNEQAAANAAGWIYLGSAYDTDAAAFIAAAAITNETQKAAVNKLVVDLKTNNLWAQLKAVYPMIGGTAAAHKFNLRNPADTDAAFRLAFFGNWTHSATGAKSDGSTGYADSFFNPSVHIPANSGALGFYSRSQDTTGAVDIGIEGSNSSLFEIHIYYNGYFNCSPNTIIATAEIITNGDTLGFYQAVRTGATTTIGQQNSVQTAFTGRPYTAPNGTALVGARRSTAGAPELFTTKECAFAYFGDALTSGDATNLYNIVQAFQVALGRAV